MKKKLTELDCLQGLDNLGLLSEEGKKHLEVLRNEASLKKEEEEFFSSSSVSVVDSYVTLNALENECKNFPNLVVGVLSYTEQGKYAIMRMSRMLAAQEDLKNDARTDSKKTRCE